MSTCKVHKTAYTHHCKECHVERQRKYRSADAAAEQARRARHYMERKERLKNPPTEKTCITCKLPKPIEKFIVRHDHKDGHAGECSACRSKGNRARDLAKAAAALPPGVTIHKMEDSKRHTSVARKSLPARGMASSEY